MTVLRIIAMGSVLALAACGARSDDRMPPAEARGPQVQDPIPADVEGDQSGNGVVTRRQSSHEIATDSPPRPDPGSPP